MKQYSVKQPQYKPYIKMFNGLYFVVACFETICYKIILIEGSGLFSAVGGQLKQVTETFILYLF